MSDDHNYFKFRDEESECPTEILEETVLISAIASECATANASVTMATSRPTRTLAKKANCSSLILVFFFGFDTDSNGHPSYNGKPTSALRLVNSERH